MKVSIAIVRHGPYNGTTNLSHLSQEGREQIARVRDDINKHFRVICSNNQVDVRPLAISFSSTARALESTVILKGDEDMFVMELFLPERDGISEPEKIVQKVLALLTYNGANVASIVAHGDMPAVFAETLVKMASGQSQRLRSPRPAEGYLVNMATGEVFTLSPEKASGERSQLVQMAAAHEPRAPISDEEYDELPF